MIKSHLDTLPPSQKALWPELAEVPEHFVLYGGTALALRLGHRQSVDFDFFSSETILPSGLLQSLRVLRGATIVQNTTETLSVLVHRNGQIKLSFFGGLKLGRVGNPEKTPDGVLRVASLVDLAGTKAAVVTQRAEAKDYVDILAIVNAGITLSEAMAAAQALYRDPYNPMMTLKALSYFGDGDLHKLTPKEKEQLLRLATTQEYSLPQVRRLSDSLSS